MSPAMSERLIALADLPPSGVASVETSKGRLAVGVAGGAPFAVSPVCRHLRGDLAKGHVADDGCLECPLHAARFDVRSGEMTRGPQGAFKPVAGVVKGTLGRMKLKTFAVAERDGVLYLEG
jgi:3-phenylpropionate/trans-cinnamate dioxygenase ferredoxin subunit